MRRAITLLQSATRLHGKELNRDAIIDVAAVIPPSVCEALMAACRSGCVFVEILLISCDVAL